MTPNRRIDIGQRHAVDTAGAMARLDGAIELMASAQKIAQEGLARHGWREPSLVVTETHRGAQRAQVFIGDRPATRAELLAMADGLSLQPAPALDEPALLAQRLGARRAV
jgi:hypothetical protein